MKKPTLWVFGFGQFMKFFIPHLHEYFDIQVYDREGWKNKGRNADLRSVQVVSGDMQQVAECDFVLLGYPAKNIGKLVQDIFPYIQSNSVVFDICSVKTPAVEAMLEYLPKECQIIATHPIFGPQSGKHGIEWLTCVLSQTRCSDEKYEFLKNIFWKKLKLRLVEMTPEEHDREMAYIQGITHFIWRALKQLCIPDSQLATCSYLDLRKSSEAVGYDTDELFLSIQQDNPYVWEVRKKLLKEFEKQEHFIQYKYD